MKKILIAPPAGFPVTLEENIKPFLRIPDTDTDSDALLEGLIGPAVDQAELETSRRLITQTWDLVFDSWEDLLWEDKGARIRRIMPFGVCRSVVSIKYLDPDKSEHTVPADQYEISGLLTDECRIVFHDAGDFDYPALYEVDPVTVRITCGYGDDGSAVPGWLKTAITVIVSDVFDGEDHEYAVKSMLKHFKLWRF